MRFGYWSEGSVIETSYRLIKEEELGKNNIWKKKKKKKEKKKKRLGGINSGKNFLKKET